jgi:hypothetical protein
MAQTKSRQHITNKNKFMLGICQILMIAKVNPKTPPVASASINDNRIKSIIILPRKKGSD